MQDPNNNMNIINNSPIADLNASNPSNSVFYIKILYLIITAIITATFGLLPLCFNNCRKNSRILSYANAFSGGIFLGIGFFHLFPEANENFEKYFATPEGKSSFIFGWPMSYLLAFLSYSLILYLEKVAFNSNALIAHTHTQMNDDFIEKGLNEPLLDKDKNEKDEVYHDCTHDLYQNDSNRKYSSDEEIGQDEQIIKNIVSSKGQFSSVLQSRNLMSSQGVNNNVKPDKNLMIASKILDRNSKNKTHTDNDKDNNNKDLLYLENNKIDIDKNEAYNHNHIFNPTSSITPYILLIALSVHGVFEGIALGVMNTIRECSILFSAIILHKWAAAFALGISFYKSGTNTDLFIKMIIIFTSFGPLGIIIGMIFSDAGNLMKGVMLSISGGTFIYVAASEVIVEEFSLSKKTNIKFLWFLLGGLLTFVLTFIE